MSEEKRILDYFGVSQLEGNVRGEHFGKLLTFLKTHSGKRFDFILRVAPLILGGMQRRYLRENYLEGLIELGIIKLYVSSNVHYYKWFGESALNGSLIPSEQQIEEQKISEEPIEESKDFGLCPNCSKKLKEKQKFCDEKCLREFYKKTGVNNG